MGPALLAIGPGADSLADQRPAPFEITGQATVIDGDTIALHATRVRLFGIDAPESRQLCVDASGQNYPCGKRAALALADRIGQMAVTCTKMDRDHYNRIVAVCRVGGLDLGAWLVAEGYAVTLRHYSSAYVQEEETARRSRRGLWAGTFVPPSDWRSINAARDR